MNVEVYVDSFKAKEYNFVIFICKDKECYDAIARVLGIGENSKASLDIFKKPKKSMLDNDERMIKGVVLFNIENTEQSTLLHEAIHLTFYLFKWQLIGIIFEKLFNIKTNNLYKHEEYIVSYIEELMNIFNSMIEEAKNKKEEE